MILSQLEELAGTYHTLESLVILQNIYGLVKHTAILNAFKPN